MGNSKQAYEYATSATELLGHKSVQQQVHRKTYLAKFFKFLALMHLLGVGGAKLKIVLQQGSTRRHSASLLKFHSWSVYR
jgi:hypothetical protein